MSTHRFSFCGFALIAAFCATACDRVDQKKFDSAYRAAKAIEVDVEHSAQVDIGESEKLFKALKTELSVLEGRTSGKAEAATLRIYNDAADAYKAFLDIRDLDLRGESVDGRMLLGEGWVSVATRFHFKTEATKQGLRDKYKFYWIDVAAAVEALLKAVRENLAEGNRRVNAG